jgi:hypothetical protein
MTAVMDRPIERPHTSPVMGETTLELDQSQNAGSLANLSSQQGSSWDGLLVWICISCWFLLVGMHVYELLAWLLG